MWNTICFDFDGTLVDTAEGLTKGLALAFEKVLGMQIDDREPLKRFIGPPFYISFKKELDLTDEQVADCVEVYREYYSTKGMYECALYPGVREMLARLQSEHFTLCVTSSKPIEYVEKMLAHLNIRSFFTAVGGAVAENPGETKAEVLEKTLRAIGMADRRDEVVLVGDTKYDMEGGKLAGVATIGITTGYGSRADLEAYVPACIVDNTTELSNVLIGQAREEMRMAAAGDPSVRGSGKPAKESIPMLIWRIVYPMLIDLGIQNAVVMIFSIALGFVLVIQGLDVLDIEDRIYSHMLLLLGVADLIMIPLYVFFFKRDEKRRQEIRRGLLSRNRFNVASFIAICLFTIGCSQLVNALVIFLKIPTETYDELSETVLTSMSLPWQILIIALMTPIVEELLFRGLIYRRTREHVNVWIASLISGLAFGVFHGNLLQGVYTSLLGFVICLIYEHYGTVWAPIVAHFANNLASTLEGHYLEEDFHISMGPYIVISIVLVIVGGLWIFLKDRRVNQI